MRGTVCPILAVILAGCTGTGALAPNLGERLVADVVCLNSMTAAGLSVRANSQTGAKDAVSVLETINAVGTSNVPITVLQACEKTLGYAVQDAQGIATKAKGAYTPK